MQTIKSMLGFPNGTPIDAVTARIAKVYKRKEINTTYGPKTIQDGYLEDASGGKIKFKAWSHPDLSALEGKEFVIHANGKGKGLRVVHESYVGANGPKTDILLEVGKDGQFQLVAVYKQTNGLPEALEAEQAPAPAPAAQNPVKAKETPKTEQTDKQSGKVYVHGATAGAAHNKAVDLLIAAGGVNLSTLEEDVVNIGAKLVRAAQRLESGDQDDTAPKAAAPTAKQELDEDVPF